MKSKVVYLAAASAAAFVITNTNVQAQTAVVQAKNDEGFYVKADAGGAIQQTVKMNGLDVGFNPGFRGDLAVGYNFCPALAAELEGGYLWNSMDTIQGFHLPSTDEGDLFQYPLLAKAVLKIPYENGLTPYFGAGIGGIRSTLHLKEVPVVDGNASDYTFAFAAEAGLRYAVTENIEVSFGYKFLGTTGYDFDFGAAGSVNTKSVYNHSILAGFIWNF
jgi:opacity protein-like surface antigen